LPNLQASSIEVARGETDRLCARIGFIAKGSLIAEGTAEEL
jgi:ABC-type multidrug transport system ATPase subunit